MNNTGIGPVPAAAGNNVNSVGENRNDRRVTITQPKIPTPNITTAP